VEGREASSDLRRLYRYIGSRERSIAHWPPRLGSISSTMEMGFDVIWSDLSVRFPCSASLFVSLSILAASAELFLAVQRESAYTRPRRLQTRQDVMLRGP
jgi:hypothetical protein